MHNRNLFYFTHEELLFQPNFHNRGMEPRGLIVKFLMYLLVSTWLQEIWTVCRIFKRNLSHRKYTPDWREFEFSREFELSTKRHQADASSKACSGESSNNRESYINFGAPFIFQNEHNNEIKTVNHINNENNQLHVAQLSSIAQPPSSSTNPQLPSSSSSFPINPVPDANEFFAYENWDELR